MKKTKSRRITSVHGSLSGKGILEVREQLEIAEQAKIQQANEKKDAKTKLTEAFLACKTRCNCPDECMAQGLKQCPVCSNVMKSQCSKAHCKLVSGGKPKMIIAAGNKSKRRAGRVTMSGKHRASAYEAIYTDSEDSISLDEIDSSEEDEPTDPATTQ